MRFFDLFRKPETKQSSTAALMVMAPGQPAWTGRDYAKLAREGYVQNVVGYRCVSNIAEAVSSVKWKVVSGEDDLSEHPVLELLARPNPNQTFAEYVQAWVSYLMLSGNVYEERIDVGDVTRELYVLRPDRMKVVNGANGFPIRYEYTVGGRKAVWDVEPGRVSPINHTRQFHPTDDFYGLSSIEPGAYSIDQHNESMAWMQSLLQNSARPSGALSSDDQMPDDAFQRLKDQFEEYFTGSRNAGRPLLLEGGLTWQAMGLSPHDMEIIEGKNSAARDVALAFGVPPQLLGIPGDNTYSNYQEARLAFWEDTVLPLVSRLAETWTNWLTDGTVQIVPDLEKIPAIVDKRRSLWEMAEASTSMTINEKRKMMGLPQIDGGNILFVDASKIPLGDAGFDFDASGAGPDVKAIAHLVGYKCDD